VIGPARVTHRRTPLPVFTFLSEPGVPPLWAMRIDEAALARVDSRSHVHDFPGLVYFEGSGGSMRHRDRRWPIEAGDAYLIRPGALVDVDDPDALLAARGWGLYFTPEALTWTGYAGPESAGPLAWRIHPLLRLFTGYHGDEPVRVEVPPEERAAWSAGFGAIEREMLERRDGYRQAALSHLVLLLVGATRLADTATPGRPEGDLLDEVFAVIEGRFRDRLSLADVAAAVNLSPGHLTTTVRRRTGRTVQDWIADRRMTEARRLLRGTDLPVQEVGRRVGYPDPGYFGRVFRRAHGVTPRGWRAAGI
jgi:AraC family transcriptional activator of pobA